MPENSKLKKYKMFVGGKWTQPASGEFFESYDPYSAKPWCLIPQAKAEDVDRAVRSAHEAFTQGDWPKLSATQRGLLMRRLGDLIAKNADALARIEVKDNGKLISEMAAQLNYVPSGTTTTAGWRTR